MKRDSDLSIESPITPNSANCNPQPASVLFKAMALGAFLICLSSASLAQSSLPFEVANPHNKKWSTEEAGRIYLAACNLVARRVRPEKPPELRPRFLLVLGARENEIVRNGAVAEVHLQAWDPARFAQAAVIMAAREILQADEVRGIARDVLLTADASITVNELKQGR